MVPRRRGRRVRRTHKKQRGGGNTRKRDSQPDPGPSQCHPAVGVEAPPQGCLPMDVLRSVAKKLGLEPTLEGKELRTEIERELELPASGGERTFLEALPLSSTQKTQLAKKYLRPPRPKDWIEDPDKWLDSNNIRDVMNQFEEASVKDGVKEFEFMGPFPIDFAAPDPYTKSASGKEKCLQTEICELRVTKALENGVKSIGIVYNLDPHYKSGSHWVANYVDIANHKCYYFDSYGVEPPPQVATFMKWLKSQDPQMDLQYSKRALQHSNTECGMYCLYVIIRLLAGDDLVQITRRKPKDADMIDNRDWMFST